LVSVLPLRKREYNQLSLNSINVILHIVACCKVPPYPPADLCLWDSTSLLNAGIQLQGTCFQCRNSPTRT
jgi:hypothetical protein